MVDDQQRPPRGHRSSGPPQHRRPVHRDGAVQELRRDQIEGALRKFASQITLDEVDAVGHSTGSGRLLCPDQSSGRDVDGDHGPAVFGEPDRVGSLSAAQIQNAAAIECGCDVG